MPTCSHIMFPVDFSERCLAVRPFVKATARQFDAKVTLMHVIQIPVAWFGGTETAYPVAFDMSTMQEELRVELGKFFDSGAASDVPSHPSTLLPTVWTSLAVQWA